MPLARSLSETPEGSRMSRLWALMPTALLKGVGPSFLSIIRGAEPRRASSTAAVRPVGPASATRMLALALVIVFERTKPGDRSRDGPYQLHIVPSSSLAIGR